jgi:hypothetical protein
MHIGFIGIDGSRYNDANVHIIDTSDLIAREVFNDVYAIIEEAIKKCEQ